MKYYIDEENDIGECEPDCVDELLYLIWVIGVDYDGCGTVESLKDVIDELVELSIKARKCL